LLQSNKGNKGVIKEIKAEYERKSTVRKRASYGWGGDLKEDKIDKDEKDKKPRQEIRERPRQEIGERQIRERKTRNRK